MQCLVLIGQENQNGLETLTSQSGQVPTKWKDAVICHIQHCVPVDAGIPWVMTWIPRCLPRTVAHMSTNTVGSLLDLVGLPAAVSCVHPPVSAE